MHLRKRAETKTIGKMLPFRSRQECHTNVEQRPGLSADVRFFIDHAVSVAVACITQNKDQRVRLVVSGKGPTSMNILLSTTEENESFRFLAYTNDSSFFGGSAPSLYVMDQSSRELEHSIFLFLAERLAGHDFVSAHIYRETAGAMFALPVLHGSSAEGTNSIKERFGSIGV